MASLQNRISVRVVIAAAVFSTLAALFGYTAAYRDAIRAGEATLQGLVGAIENTAAIGAYASDAVLVEEVANGLITNDLVGGVEVRFADETVVDLGTASGQSYSDWFGGNVVVEHDLKSPFANAEVIGKILVHADMGQLSRQAGTQALLLAGLMALQVVLVAGVLGFVVNRIVGVPMARIAAQLAVLVPGRGLAISKPAGHEKDEIGILVDTTNRLLGDSEKALRRESELLASKAAMEAQYRKIFNTSSAGIFMLDEAGRLIDCNPTTLEIINQPLEVIRHCSGRQLLRLVLAHPAQTIRTIRTALAEKASYSADIEVRINETQTRWVHCLLSEHQGSRAQERIVEGVMYDVTERRQNEAKSRHMAMHDQLTGLLNRAALHSEMTHYLRAQRNARRVRYTLLYIDLDGFKPVNDTHGHHAGDVLLIECAQRMLRCVRETDLVFRLGGDEFMIILLGISIQEHAVAVTTQKLLSSINEPYVVGPDLQVSISASIGLASVPEHGEHIDAAMVAADSAMYYIKKLGKSGMVVAYPREGDTPGAGKSTSASATALGNPINSASSTTTPPGPKNGIPAQS